MNDHLKKKTDKIKRFSESVKRRAGLYSDLAKMDDKKTAQSLRALIKAPDPGRKITKIGFIIFWIPEPIGITNARSEERRVGKECRSRWSPYH